MSAVGEWILADAAYAHTPPTPKRGQEDWPDVCSGDLWFACRHPERPFDEDTALHDCCRACLLAARVAVTRGYLAAAEGGISIVDALAARIDEYGEAPE